MQLRLKQTTSCLNAFFFAKSWGALDISKWCKLCILGRQLNLLPIQVLLKSCQSSELVAPSGDAEGSMAAMEWNQNVVLMPSHELEDAFSPFIAEKFE